MLLQKKDYGKSRISLNISIIHLAFLYILDPCLPSPCGPHSTCTAIGPHYSCKCLEGYFGSPPYCRSECHADSQCPYDQRCYNYKCVNACLNLCGKRAVCRYRSYLDYSKWCLCPRGYYGNTYIGCQNMGELM